MKINSLDHNLLKIFQLTLNLMRFSWATWNIYKPISYHWSFSIHPENIRKQEVRGQWHEISQLINTPTNRKTLLKLSQTFETGLADHHKLILTIMKSGSFKGPPRKKIYRSYKTFDTENSNTSLQARFDTVISYTYNEFEKSFSSLSWRRPLSYRNQSIDFQSKSMDRFLYANGLRHERVKCLKHPPRETKMLRNVFMIKELRKEIMTRSKLKNKFNNSRSYENWFWEKILPEKNPQTGADLAFLIGRGPNAEIFLSSLRKR